MSFHLKIISGDETSYYNNIYCVNGFLPPCAVLSPRLVLATAGSSPPRSNTATEISEHRLLIA